MAFTQKMETYSKHINHTSRAGFSIRHTGSKIWNSIPISVRECSNKREFLKLLKKKLYKAVMKTIFSDLMNLLFIKKLQNIIAKLKFVKIIGCEE